MNVDSEPQTPRSSKPVAPAAPVAPVVPAAPAKPHESVRRGEGGSEIHDLGYRPYQGKRLGPIWSMRSLFIYSLRRALGLKRRNRLKMAPFFSIFAAWMPAIGVIFGAVFIRDASGMDSIAKQLLDYAGYINQISFPLMLFCVAAIPGVLTTDRTTGMLAMYMASPLTRSTYFLSKALAIFVVLMALTVAPILFLVTAAHLLGFGDGGIMGFFKVFAQALGAGTLMSLCLGSIAMFVSSIPKRWSLASVGIFGALSIPNLAAEMLYSSSPGRGIEWVAFLSPFDVVSRAWAGIFQGRLESFSQLWSLHSSTSYIIAAIIWTVVLCAVTWWRYQKMPIDR